MATKSKRIRKFTEAEEALYKEWKRKSGRRKALREKVDELTERIDEINKALRPAFKGTDRRMLNDKHQTVVKRVITPVKAIIATAEMVGEIIREAYKRISYKELED